MPMMAALLALGTLWLADTPAHAGGPREAILVDGPRVRGVGCYWVRERLLCSRYCYIEVNNRQYCQPRLHDAVAQGQVLVIETPRRRPYRGAKD